MLSMSPSALAFNPILPGFHPDPSILRVGSDYYIATSTFEWYPGVLIYHSRDLARWELVATPLDRPSLLDMRGVPDSCGVWAPCLSHDGHQFYLTYTVVRRFFGDFKDTPNYFTTAPSITGPWSERSYLNSSGFDPSVFHHEDKKWYVNMIWDHRPETTRVTGDAARYFYGIVLQELDLETRTLVGPSKRIFHRGPRGLTEGPHLYYRDGWYYLLVAEGGTSLHHAALFARSRQIDGPYESDPEGYIVTSEPKSDRLLRAGHGSLVETEAGDWFLAHLCSRPLPGRGRSVMGRETALQAVRWSDDGWPRLAHGNHRPQMTVSTTLSGPTEQPAPQNERVDFDDDRLPLNFQTLRFGLGEDMLSLKERPGWLRLKGRHSLGSTFEQSLVARRQQAFRFSVSTCVDFSPDSFQQFAGLVCYYGQTKYLYLHISHHEERGRILDLSLCLANDHCSYPLPEPILLPDDGVVWMGAEVEYDQVKFWYGLSEGDHRPIPGAYDYSHLSDEVGGGGSGANFTGAFVGLACQDLTGAGRAADFDFFSYEERPEEGQ